MRRYVRLPQLRRLKQLFRYDPQTGALLSLQAGSEVGYVNNIGYRQIYIDGRIYSVHRLVWKLVHGAAPRGEIDHINGNPSDNRLVNLRLASSSENNRNRKLSARNKTGVKGVFWVTKARRYRAVVGHNRQYHILGHFVDFDEAVAVADAARKQLHGEFANRGT